MSLIDHDCADSADRTLGLLLAEHDSLRRFVAGLMGRDPHGVEDVVQETLLRAWQSAERLDWRDRPIRMWLFRVARNLVVDGRRRDRAVPVGITAADFGTAAPAPVPDHAEQVGDRFVLLSALRTLAPAHQEVVARVHLLGQTGEDVARQLGVPRGTVKSRTHHGMRTLRTTLEAHGVHAPRTTPAHHTAPAHHAAPAHHGTAPSPAAPAHHGIPMSPADTAPAPHAPHGTTRTTAADAREGEAR